MAILLIYLALGPATAHLGQGRESDPARLAAQGLELVCSLQILEPEPVELVGWRPAALWYEGTGWVVSTPPEPAAFMP